MFLTFYDLVKYFFGLAILISLTFCDLFAQTGELRRPVQGIRNLGMGNAGIALSFDENALYYNPAGLASVTLYWLDSKSIMKFHKIQSI